ncbi:MAG: phosphoribosylanthranilate isomerase [Spirochaetia bacterium]|nr:phosphoribosylanthranilate isomerase [Spirochaetia bacterium]
MISKLKICGIRRIEDILMVNEIKPEFIGFVFAKSKRQIDLNTAIELKRKLNSDIKCVGVFVNEDIDQIVKIVDSKAIDIIQLHGDESNDYIKLLKEKVSAKIIKVIKINSDLNGNTSFSQVDYLLYDSGNGSGKPFDWNININKKKPTFIAGGININNIEEAYKIFNPFAFDVSSGVEVGGYKNLDKMREIKTKLDSLNGENNE